MTPFGMRLRELRAARGITMGEMASALGVSSAYLSALEHGRRGKPAWAFVQAVIGYFNIIWDEADDLHRIADLSHPRIQVDTAGLSPGATRLANRLARDIASLDEDALAALEAILDEAGRRRRDA